jgi:hypothetical protein
MLEQLFSSRTRIKLLSIFLANPSKDFFVRELTRITDEQINSIRRELDNLKRIGLLKSKSSKNKKFFIVNENFPIFEELKSIFSKLSGPSEEITNSLLKFGDIDLISISGKLIECNDSNIELLIVGNIDKELVEKYLKSLENTKKHEIRFTVLDKKDFLFRIKCHDRFLKNYLKNEKHIIIYDKIKLKQYI